MCVYGVICSRRLTVLDLLSSQHLPRHLGQWGWQTYSFRRGTRPAAIHSLAFSPASVRPALLCAASGRGSVHLYRLEEHERCGAPSLRAKLFVHRVASRAGAC